MKTKLQAAFNKVWQYFVVEAHGPSYTQDGCEYRGDDGARCAVGVLIPDDEYVAGMEGLTIDDMLSRFQPICLQELPRAALCQLQEIHDSQAHEKDRQLFRNSMDWRLRAFADEYGLAIPAPTIPEMDFIEPLAPMLAAHQLQL